MDALSFLEQVASSSPPTPRPLYVLHVDDPFLERQVRRALRRLVLSHPHELKELSSEDEAADKASFALATFSGEKAAWAAVHDELETLPFLSPRRLVIVEDADTFVSRERSRLEKFVTGLSGGKTAGERPHTGTLVLCVTTWASNTKLAKMVPEASLLLCKTPESSVLITWAVRWCLQNYGKQLAAGASRLLIDLIGPEMGLIDQELAKLAVYVGEANRIEVGDVDQLVGRSRLEDTWKIFNYIGNGQVSEALTYLDQLLTQGKDVRELLGAFSYRMRQLAQAGRLAIQGVPLQEAFDRIKLPDNRGVRSIAESQMRHLGRRRLDRLYEWLLQVDSGVKGGSQLPERTQLERLIVQLATRPTSPQTPPPNAVQSGGSRSQTRTNRNGPK